MLLPIVIPVVNKSLLFIPDISGFTQFIQTTEVEHSQHVIAELLEILIEANTQDLQLAEVEGDALFFYKEGEIPSLEKLLAQVETMFTAFYSHLKLFEKNRICPCNACASAPNLNLKIIAHSGELQFITIQDNRKPFGSQVIEAHRLMKNSIQSDKYLLLSKELTTDIQLPTNYHSKLFDFKAGKDKYDGKEIKYLFSIISQKELKLRPYAQAKKLRFGAPPALSLKREFPISTPQLLEYLTNYRYRHHWVQGVDKFEYNKEEVTKIGTEHTCVINGKNLDFIVVTKEGKPGQLVYGEMTTSLPPVDELYQFFIVTPLTNDSCQLEIEVYWKAKSPVKKLMIALFVKKIFQKNTQNVLDSLLEFVKNNQETQSLA